MLQAKIYGRGGQGAQMAAQILAAAFFLEGKYVQAFASYGGARRGALVSSFMRVDDRPIRLRCEIEDPDALLIFDVSLIDDKLIKGINKDTIVIVNSAAGTEKLKDYKDLQIYNVDGKEIASRNGLGRIVNSALIGAFAGFLDAPNFKDLLKVVQDMSPAKVDENISSCRDGYALARKLKGVV